jgi:hypothetical protein
MATIPYRGPGWPDRLLTRVGRLHLILEGYRRLDSLPVDLKGELRSLLGFTQPSDDVLASGERVSDTWSVIGRRVVADDRLVTQRTWLSGQQAQRFALILDFAPGRGAPQQHGLDLSLVPGTTFRGTLAFFQGASRQRALVVQRESPNRLTNLPGEERIDRALASAAHSLSKNPWLGRVPIALKGVRAFHRADEWFVLDAEGGALPMMASSGWKLLAISGGHPVDLFGEWTWEHFDVLSAIGSDGFALLGQVAP